MVDNIRGVEVDSTRSHDNHVYIIIDEEEYSDTFSQVGIINFMELSKPDDLITFYCVGDGDYFTAKEFRTAYGYDNRFFEKMEPEARDSIKWYKDHAEELLGIMDWQDIVFQLLDDPMIKSCGCDGLLDAYRVLNGLLGMSEIMNITDDFILEALNASINARNRYCSLNGAEKIKPVQFENNKFIWERI